MPSMQLHTQSLDTIPPLPKNLLTILILWQPNIGSHYAYQAHFDDLKLLVQTDNQLLKNLNLQVSQLPLSQGHGSSHQPKIGEPPEFNGTDGKMKFNKWLNKVSLWLVHEGVATDKQ